MVSSGLLELLLGNLLPLISLTLAPRRAESSGNRPARHFRSWEVVAVHPCVLELRTVRARVRTWLLSPRASPSSFGHGSAHGEQCAGGAGTVRRGVWEAHLCAAEGGVGPS